jgi:hypothetical protein
MQKKNISVEKSITSAQVLLVVSTCEDNLYTIGEFDEMIVVTARHRSTINRKVCVLRTFSFILSFSRWVMLPHFARRKLFDLQSSEALFCSPLLDDIEQIRSERRVRRLAKLITDRITNKHSSDITDRASFTTFDLATGKFT